MTGQPAVNPRRPGAPPELDAAPVRLFAEPLRARLVGLLAAEPLCTCHLAEATGALPTAVSNHLRQLRGAGVVEAEPRGRYTYHRLRPEVLARVADQFTALARAARAVRSAQAPPRRPC